MDELRPTLVRRGATPGRQLHDRVRRDDRAATPSSAPAPSCPRTCPTSRSWSAIPAGWSAGCACAGTRIEFDDQGERRGLRGLSAAAIARRGSEVRRWHESPSPRSPGAVRHDPRGDPGSDRPGLRIAAVHPGAGGRRLWRKRSRHSAASATRSGVSSGTDALLAALMALGVGPGDEVITTPYSFFATAGTIARLGARPVFVDIEPRRFNLDASMLAPRSRRGPRRSCPSTSSGAAATWTRVERGRRSDTASPSSRMPPRPSARGTTRGRSAGTMGAVGCLSFFPSKNLGAFGDGGHGV